MSILYVMTLKVDFAKWLLMLILILPLLTLTVDRRPCQMARKAELGNQAGAGDAQPIFWRTGNLVLSVQPIGRRMLKPAI